MGQSALDRKPVAVKSGHGTGKTCLASWVIQWYLFTHPYSKCGVTAPTERQLKNGLWGELSKWTSRSPILQSFFKWKTETYEVKGYGIVWAAEMRAAYRPENLAGLHGEGGTLMVVDEASGIINDEIWDTIMGALSDVGSVLLMIGNPTQIRGHFHRQFADKKSNARQLTLSCLEPGYRGDPGFPKEIEDKYGKDSDQYRVRVKGEFPIDSPDAFMKLSWLQDCYDRPFSQSLTPVVAIDPADMGDDDSEIAAGTGYRLRYWKTLRGETDGMMNAQAVLIAVHYLRENCKEFGFHEDVTIQVVVDCTGPGTSTRDQLRQFEVAENIKVHAIHSAESGDAEYAKMSDRLWGNMKSLIRNVSIPYYAGRKRKMHDGFDDEEFFEELEDQVCGRKYEIGASDGKIHLESKADLKKRGKCSPNMGDALALYLYPFMRYGLDNRPKKGQATSLKVQY